MREAPGANRADRFAPGERPPPRKNQRLPLAIALPFTLLGAAANAAKLRQWDSQYAEGSPYVDLYFLFENDDPGAIYNEAQLGEALFIRLAEQLYALEHNQQAYGCVEELMADWYSGITSDGSVYSGWNSTPVGQGDVVFTNIGGIPGLTFDVWSEGNDLGFYLAIPTAQLSAGEFNHDSHYILAAGSQVENAFIGWDGGGGYGAPANHYVVPEPATLLLGATGVAVLARKRIAQALATAGTGLSALLDRHRT